MNASFYFVFIDDFINFLPVIGRFKHIYFRMKNLKKLTLHKEVVSFLGENDMNQVKGGTGYGNTYFDGYTAPVDKTKVVTLATCVSCVLTDCQATCQSCTCPPPPPPPPPSAICHTAFPENQSCYPCGDM